MYKLSVEDVHKQFGNHEVLKGISLNAKSGDVISIIGSSGSGKSTFLRCINFLEQPSAGRVTIDGEEIRTVLDKAGAGNRHSPESARTCRRARHADRAR
jgi:histidine transport system ATP-binding protein